ncbi:unnamed protein product, partial [Mycena citricolor]
HDELVLLGGDLQGAHPISSPRSSYHHLSNLPFAGASFPTRRRPRNHPQRQILYNIISCFVTMSYLVDDASSAFCENEDIVTQTSYVSHTRFLRTEPSLGDLSRHESCR